MEGYEAFKKLRVDSGFSVRKFAACAEISPRTLTYYENGENSLLCIPTEKAVCLFSLLNVSITEFFYQYYPIKHNVEVILAEWNKTKERVTDKEKVKIRLKNRIYKMKERNIIDAPTMDGIISEYEKQMTIMYKVLGKRKDLSEEEYDQFVLPILCLIRRENKPIPENKRTYAVTEALYHTEFSIPDLANIIGVSQQHLKSRLNKGELEKLHIETILKLCLVLKIDFEKLFETSNTILKKDIEKSQ